MKKIVGLIIVLLITLSTLKATHITHGNMYYEYMGKDSIGNWKYKVSLVLYRDCVASPVSFDNNIKIVAYNGGSGYFLAKIYDVDIRNEQVATSLDIGVSNVGGCYRKAVYESNIVLTPSLLGYYVVWNRCCRTSSNNLVDDNSANYTVFIPSEPNNSASLYSNAPISAGTNTITNIGVGVGDKDNDSITYKLTNSLNGSLSAVSPIWGNIESKLAIPISPVKYRNGYLGVNPMGNDGFASVSPTGILRIQSSKQGKYFISILVSEWRNGQLLTENVRDFVVDFITGNISSTEVFLKAETFVKKEITLNWGMAVKSLDADSFTVERKLKNTSSWSYLVTTKANDYGFNDTSVLYDTLYQYQVTAYLNNGSTRVSNTEEAIIRSWKTNSLKEFEGNRFTIYPNPATNKLFINSTEQIGIDKVTITDIQGKVVSQTQNVGDALANGITVSQLLQGVYLLKIFTKTGGIETLKILKQ